MLRSVDLQVNGGWGIDLLKTKSFQDLDLLATKLFKNGTDAFCPTLITSSFLNFCSQVQLIGKWIESFSVSKVNLRRTRSYPLGLHLEGPSISPLKVGAHPKKWVRPLKLTEWQQVLDLAHGHIAWITFAPETFTQKDLKAFCRWADKNKIQLSIGHSAATQEQAQHAFDEGVRSVTHAWNALQFHQREPGVLGAALGRKDIFIQLIPHTSHVHPTVARWLSLLHPTQSIIAVSDLAPCAGLKKNISTSFGDMTIFNDGHGCARMFEKEALVGLSMPLSVLAGQFKKSGFGWLDKDSIRSTPLRFLRKRVNLG